MTELLREFVAGMRRERRDSGDTVVNAELPTLTEIDLGVKKRAARTPAAGEYATIELRWPGAVE